MVKYSNVAPASASQEKLAPVEVMLLTVKPVGAEQASGVVKVI